MEFNWEAISAIGSILGAAGSFAAVLVALRLAREAGKPQLSIEMLLGLQFSPNRYRDWIVVTIVNTGSRAETIASIWLRARGSKERMLFELSREDGVQLPRAIDAGEAIDLLFNPIEFSRDLGRAGHLLHRRSIFGFFSTRRISVGAQTITGHGVVAPVSAAVQQFCETSDGSLLVSNRLHEDHPAKIQVGLGLQGFYSTRYRKRPS